jgi:hypothetical protein
MTDRARTLRALNSVTAAVNLAVAETKLAYQFNANSYSFSAMDACMTAELALDRLREALENLCSQNGNERRPE